MVLAADYPFLNIFWTMIIFFAWGIWFWMVIVILTDTFRRDDLSGWAKAGWAVLLIVFPFIGMLATVIRSATDRPRRRVTTRTAASRADLSDSPAAVAAAGRAAGEIRPAKE